MSKQVKFFIVILRLTMGWVLFYSGVIQILDSSVTIKPFLDNAQLFSGFFNALASSEIFPFVSLLNEWALLLIGGALIVGAFVRFAGIVGAILMLIHSFAVVDLPAIPYQFVYVLVLSLLSVARAGRFLGIDRRWRGY